jgi:hypothetical protein
MTFVSNAQLLINMEGLYVRFMLKDKKLYLEFADDIRIYNFLPQYIGANDQKLFEKYEACTLCINLENYKINYSRDDRIVRNRIYRYENYKKIEALQTYIAHPMGLNNIWIRKYQHGLRRIPKLLKL